VHDKLRHFRRDEAGVWACVDPVELELPTGRIQVAVGERFRRGTTFMGVDIAQLLDEQAREDDKR
jgi:hypothetical protein